MFNLRVVLLLIAALFLGSCKSAPSTIDPGKEYKIPDTYNFKLVCYDNNIQNPANDRRSFYKVYINKVERGRTTTGLESQRKFLELKLQPNRHLLRVEKWVLDVEAGSYVKLNNIDQPKPSFTYFDLPPERIIIMSAITELGGKTVFTLREEMN